MSTSTQRQRILDLLQAQKSVLNTQLNAICYRYGARLHELRNEGHLIVTAYVEPGIYRFTYHGGPGAPKD